MKKLTVILVMLLCLTMAACGKEKKDRVAPTRSTNPIMNLEPSTPSDKPYRTAVYVTVYGDTAYLATYPYEVPAGDMTLEEELQNTYEMQEISDGKPILYSGYRGVPITTVVIVEAIGPGSTANWFRNMTQLRKISGVNNLRMENVTDMSNMFNGCTRLSELNAEKWDVSKVTDMRGAFDGCDALETKPSWYTE